MNKVLVYGEVAEKYGHEFNLAVRDPAEAIRAMHIQLPGFAQMCADQNYVAVREFKNGSFAMTEEHFYLGMNGGTIHLVPDVEGAASGKGIGKTILGIALIAGSFLIPGSTLVLGIAVHTLALTLGISLALSGIAMLLSPTPTIGGKEKKDNSFLFNGDTNTSDQGICVPITYGYDRVKPIPIATRVKTNEYTIGAAVGIGGIKGLGAAIITGGQTNTNTSLGGLNTYDGQTYDTTYSNY